VSTMEDPTCVVTRLASLTALGSDARRGQEFCQGTASLRELAVAPLRSNSATTVALAQCLAYQDQPHSSLQCTRNTYITGIPVVVAHPLSHP
jgi:hypothetical protein